MHALTWGFWVSWGFISNFIWAGTQGSNLRAPAQPRRCGRFAKRGVSLLQPYRAR
ncbi:hypothetical protein C8D87_11188 [Lentzea atacamensis]|uniref:Uncharacterized protein n=1 Tax=Lentzea atacamensis TaxID=531938 RepID=A0ABX9DY99_9PSEU|nr:hypothetical protein C8D87_11188 [Lentzea atacamensis]